MGLFDYGDEGYNILDAASNAFSARNENFQIDPGRKFGKFFYM